ncbi:hypothetical protein [Alkalibacillus haloalkaliphilus]|uniref:hypothetical protein n=1 Tax=Alkalibacillus haloalkaliphilus TaxID=94136 RepID=UPI00293680A6|nr:hypothetical protein [Alkalibacillus haloalkaliphilus]MDV2583497.1 hypothetical protein [Alkalibacillus haloalkaliphilus]
MYYHTYYLTPKNSVDLFFSIISSESHSEMDDLMVEGYESEFNVEDYQYMSDINSNRENKIMQFTVVDYYDKAFVIRTAPGLDKQRIMKVEQLPGDIQEYLLELTQDD